MPEEDKPTLLVVGQGDPMEAALLVALQRHNMFVESAPASAAVKAVFTAAPDLVVLLGDAVSDEGSDVLRALAGHPATAVMPVAILADDPALDQRLRAFKHGAVAVVPRSASVDDMARRIAELAQELPQRPGAKAGPLGEATVEELVELFSREIRNGILSISQKGGQGARFLLRADRPVTDAVEDFIRRIRPMLEEAKPLDYEFHEAPVGQLQILDADTPHTEDVDPSAFKDRRIVLVDRNPATADVLAQELRQHGATVVVTDGEGAAFDRVRELDPEMVLIDEEGLNSWAYAVMSRFRRDARLRWASVLVFRGEELWPPEAPGPNLSRLAHSAGPLFDHDLELRRRALSDVSFGTRLEVLGPSRTLQALVTVPHTLHVTVRHPRVVVEVDLAEGLVVGARCTRLDAPGSRVDGLPALAALLALSSGRVHVSRRQNPSTANVLSPVRDAVHAAEHEDSPIKPSLPPPSLPPEGAKHPDPVASVAAPNVLVEQLRALVAEIQEAPAGGGGLRTSPLAAAAVALGSAAAEGRAPRVGRGPDAPTAPRNSQPYPEVEGAHEPAPVTRKKRPRPPESDTRKVDEPAAAALIAASAVSERPPTGSRRLVLAVSILGAILAGILGGTAFYFFLGPEAVALPGSGLVGGDETARVPGVRPEAEAPTAAGASVRVPAAKAPADELEDSHKEAPAAEGPDAETEAAAAVPAVPEGPEEEVAAAEAEGEEAPAAAAAAAEPEGDSQTSSDADEKEHDAESADRDERRADSSREEHDPIRRLVEQANRERRNGSAQAAEEHYKEALTMKPAYPRALAGIARLYVALKRYRDAEPYAARLTRVRPLHPANHVLHGDILRELGNEPGARAEYRKALEVAPDDARARSRLGL